MAREFNEKKFYTDFCERLGFISLQQECGLGDWRGAVARVELLDRLLVDALPPKQCVDAQVSWLNAQRQINLK